MRAALLAPLAFLLALLAGDQLALHPASLVGLALVATVTAALVAARALPTAHPPAVAVRARRRALDQGPAPRQHDPDAAGHTRSRAPSRTPRRSPGAATLR